MSDALSVHIGFRFHAETSEGDQEWTVTSINEKGSVTCDSARGSKDFSRAFVEDRVVDTVRANAPFDNDTET
jgi:hypothetical protein